MKRLDVDLMKKIVEWADEHPDEMVEVYSEGSGEILVELGNQEYGWEDLLRAMEKSCFPGECK